MKFSIPISILILAGAAGIGWHDHQRLATVRRKHARLVAEAAGIGITLDSSRQSDSIRVTKHERTHREAEPSLAAAEVIALAKELETIQQKGGPDEAMQKRILDVIGRMMSLDAAQLKILITAVREAKDLKDETRQGLLGFSIMTLANDHPQAALALFTESSDLFKRGMSNHVISSSLARWAKDDPAGALAWMRQNGEKFPDLITDEAKRGLVSGTAVNDPKLAFKLIGELGIKNANQAISEIVEAAKTPEDRTATLTALRDHLGSFPDEKSREETGRRAISVLARDVVDEGFTAATQWLAEANLNSAELDQFAGGLHISRNNTETGQWVEWLGEKLPDGKSGSTIKNLVSQWTQKDYQAAGKWLSTTPNGSAKNAAVISYAETISKYEPETAAQWAMTLPAGVERTSTLQNIYRNWPKDNAAAEAAAAAFAKEHGIK